MPAKNKPNEIYLTRIYDAPVKLVWEAWTDPNQVAKWWGPRGFTLTTHSKDLRPGGHWKYTMHGPDGVDYPNTTIYHEVEKHSRLVYDHGGSEDRPPLFRVDVTFAEAKGKTKMEMTMSLASAEAAQEIKKFIKKAGGESTWDRLAEFLSETSQQKDIFVINRSFDAPIETMFTVWTDPAHLSQWLPPTGFSMAFKSADIRKGGHTSYSMTNGSFTMFGRASYIEITPPNRLVYTQQFCTESGEISRHPMAPIWPETMLTIVEFAAESVTKTRVTITWQVFGKATKEEQEAFHNAKGGMTQGWTGSLDKLEDHFTQMA